MMKKHTIIVCNILAIFMLLNGCENQNKTHTSPSKDQNSSYTNAYVNKEFILAPGQGAELKGENLEIYFLDVESDSRCPSDTQCVTRGTVNITIQAKENGEFTNKNSLSLNVGQTEPITEKYELEFIEIQPERGKVSEEINKKDYRATLKVKSIPSGGPVIELKDPAGIIFSKESLHDVESLQSYTDFKKSKTLWSPSVEEAKKADTIVKKCIDDKIETIKKLLVSNLSNEDSKKRASEYYRDQLVKIDEKYSKYYRQYIGYLHEENNHKLIWINFFMPNNSLLENWRKIPVLVSDGGYYYFNVLVDIDNSECISFFINGEA